MTVTLSRIVLRVPDMDRAIEFYKALGFEFEKVSNAPYHYSAINAGFALEIHWLAGEPPTLGLRLSFVVDDIEQVLKTVEQTDGRVLVPPSEENARRGALLRDPDGNKIEVAEGVPPWGLRHRLGTEELQHNESLARMSEEYCPDWRVTAMYDASRDGEPGEHKKGWYKIEAPAGAKAILDLNRDAPFPPGWVVQKEYVQVCYNYTITSPTGETMSFADDWNA
jgi:catechol 2,3-dioxygenase-like lactoylglutathione lyase family enzyme